MNMAIRGRLGSSLAKLFEYRNLVYFLVRQDLSVRYRYSALGFLWTLLNPLLLMLVMWAVFSRVAKVKTDNYPLFLLSGLMCWIFFSQSAEKSLTSVVGNKSLIQKVYIPKLVFPLTVVTSNLVNLLFFLTAYLGLSLAMGHSVPYTAATLPALLLMLFLLGLGTATTLSTLNVFFRDFTHLTGPVLRALFYLTPVFYAPSMLGERAQSVLRMNPLYYPIVMVRGALYEGILPSMDQWITSYAICGAICLVGLLLFTAFEDRFVYYI